MARKIIKTMADKMAESGKSIGKNVLDDTDLATDPIISALQTLRLTIDDMQYNDANHGTDKQTSLISANTAKTGITTGQASAITANTAKTGISDSQASAITANSTIVNKTKGTIEFGAPDRNGAMTITVKAGDNKFTYTIAAN